MVFVSNEIMARLRRRVCNLSGYVGDSKRLMDDRSVLGQAPSCGSE